MFVILKWRTILGIAMSKSGIQAISIPALTPQQVAQMYNGYNSQSAQQQAANQYGQMIANLGRSQSITARWMFDGQLMDLVDFANAVFGKDTPEATHFVLKHSK